MVTYDISDDFKKATKRYRSSKSKIRKQMKKIIENPKIGKPMRHERKGTRELYIQPFRLAYLYHNEKIIFLTIYHKDEQ